jgi:hypothetical protein
MKIEIVLQRLVDLIRYTTGKTDANVVRSKLEHAHNELFLCYMEDRFARPVYAQSLLRDPVITSLVKADLARPTIMGVAVRFETTDDIYALAESNPDLMIVV